MDQVRESLPTRRAVASGALASGLAQAARAKSAAVVLYAGCNAVGPGVGITRLVFDPAKGAFTDVHLAAETASPANLFLHPNRRVLYTATGEGAAVDGQNQIQAFRLDGATAARMASLPCGGATPVQGMVDPAHGLVATANYRGDNLCLVPLKADGGFAAPAATLLPIPDGKGLKPHQVVAAPAQATGGRFAVVPLIGGDRCDVYRLGAGALTRHGTARTPAGLGPRHAAFHPNGRLMFSSDETGSAVSSFSWDAGRGRLEHLSSTPATGDPKPGNRPSHVGVHPNGRFVYVANRGPGSISTFAVDAATGALTKVAETSGGGASAWHFAIVGPWLLVANMSDDRVSVLAIDPATGAPTLTGAEAKVKSPTSLARV